MFHKSLFCSFYNSNIRFLPHRYYLCVDKSQMKLLSSVPLLCTELLQNLISLSSSSTPHSLWEVLVLHLAEAIRHMTSRFPFGITISLRLRNVSSPEDQSVGPVSSDNVTTQLKTASERSQMWHFLLTGPFLVSVFFFWVSVESQMELASFVTALDDSPRMTL